MARTPQSTLDDSYKAIPITSFDGGMVTTASPLILGSNQSPAMLNVIHLPGRLMYRGGYLNFCPTPGSADGSYSFYDQNGTKHWMVWANGNVYDCVSGVATVVEAAVYTAGQRIGVCDLQGILYWSTGQPNPVPIRFWNPKLNTKGALPASGSGDINPPASDFLMIYTNAIVALAPTWAGSYQPNVMCWSDINAPATWRALNSQAVGPLNNGRVEFARPFGIAEVGVPPFGNIIVGRNDFGIFAYKGALGSLQEALLNCPVGIKDRDSAQYLPTAGSFGTIVWLGNDGQVWASNGITCQVISGDILPTLQAAYGTAIANNNAARFYSGYNQQWQYYYLDVGGTQFVYRWPTNSWTMFQGWPSGPSFSTFDGTGAPAYYVASAAPSGNNLSQIGVIGSADNGVMPAVYYTSPVLHGGNFNLFKDFHWGAIAVLDNGVQYQLSASSIKRTDGSQMVASNIPLTAPANPGGNPFIVGSSLLGGSDVLSGPGQVLSSGTPVVMQGRFAVPIAADEWYPNGHMETLKGNGCQLTISRVGGANRFDLLGAEVLYVSRGYRRGSGGLYSPDAVANQPFDPFSVQ